VLVTVPRRRPELPIIKPADRSNSPTILSRRDGTATIPYCATGSVHPRRSRVADPVDSAREGRRDEEDAKRTEEPRRCPAASEPSRCGVSRSGARRRRRLSVRFPAIVRATGRPAAPAVSSLPPRSVSAFPLAARAATRVAFGPCLMMTGPSAGCALQTGLLVRQKARRTDREVPRRYAADRSRTACGQYGFS